MLLEEYPEGAKVVWQRSLPIHLTCGNRAVNLDVLDLLIELYPESINIPGPGGRTPSEQLRFNTVYYRRPAVLGTLLLDAVKGGFSVNVCQLILSAFPERTHLIRFPEVFHPMQYSIRNYMNYENRGNHLDVFLLLLNRAPHSVCDDAKAKTAAKMLMSPCDEDTGTLLLHQSAANRHFSLTVLKFLNCVYPSSVSKLDGWDMLPFHYACLNPDVTVDVLMTLLLFYPASIAIKKQL
jgi:hypothetical protein